MRWLFADPNNADEAAYVYEKLAAIDRWWQEFQTNSTKLENYLKRTTRWDFTTFMEENLQAIDPHLMWEFGPALRSPGNRLVITPESHRHLRPMVRTLLERAPAIPGWEFYPYRLPETTETAVATVQGRIDVDVSAALVEAAVAPGHKIDLTYWFPGQPDLDEELAQQAAFVATESLFGEQVLDTWIGDIRVTDHQRREGRPLTLEAGQAAVAALIRSLLQQLPASRAQNSEPRGEWTKIELEPPQPANDHSGRDDLAIVTTSARNAELFQAFLSGHSFTSICHSRAGETFCYLKLDANDQPAANISAFWEQLSDAIDPMLLDANVGCCIGGGSGLRYAYIDLAITDLKRSVPILRKALAECRAPIRSWLLFHDDDLAAEWIGIYRETPEPPQPPTDDERG